MVKLNGETQLFNSGGVVKCFQKKWSIPLTTFTFNRVILTSSQTFCTFTQVRKLCTLSTSACSTHISPTPHSQL